MLIDLNILSFAADRGGGGGQPRAVPAGAGARAHHGSGGGSARHGAVPRPRFVFTVGDSQYQCQSHWLLISFLQFSVQP